MNEQTNEQLDSCTEKHCTNEYVNTNHKLSTVWRWNLRIYTRTTWRMSNVKFTIHEQSSKQTEHNCTEQNKAKQKQEMHQDCSVGVIKSYTMGDIFPPFSSICSKHFSLLMCGGIENLWTFEMKCQLSNISWKWIALCCI